MSDSTGGVVRYKGRVEEGAHRDEPVEWWYVNSILSAPDTPFDGWVFVTIFTSFRNAAETVHGLLVPPEGEPVDLSGYRLSPGSITNSTEGVDVRWRNNFIKGHYPAWKVHFEGTYNDQSYQIDLDCESAVDGDSNTYRFENSYLHHFACLKTGTKGTITAGGNSYDTSGIGYYEHFWGFLDFSQARGWYWYWTPSTEKDSVAINVGLGVFRDGSIPLAFVIFTPDGKQYLNFENYQYKEIAHDEHGGVAFASKFSIEEKNDDGELKAVITRKPSSYRSLNKTPLGSAIFVTGLAELEGHIKWHGKEYDVAARAFGSAMLFDLKI